MEDRKNENQENNFEESSPMDENKFAYKTVINGSKNSRLYSVLSVVFAGLSFFLSFLTWIPLIFGALGIVFALISRKNLGYFDNLGLAGLIVGIFGTVFAVFGIIFSLLVTRNVVVSFFELFFGGTSSGGGNLPNNGYYV